MNAVFFDWNGTLLADSRACLAATNETLTRLRKPNVTMKTYREHAIVPLINMYKGFGCTDAEMTDDIITEWMAVYKKHAAKAQLRKGARDALHSLNKLSCDKLIFSNYVVDEIAAAMRRLGISASFDAILANTSNHTPMKKSKIGHIETYLAKRPGLRGLIVGDTVEEVRIARETGLVAVSITSGVCSSERLRAARPDYVIRSLAELPAIAATVFDDKDKKGKAA
jgi:phosphoglycolate phosphatase-like HAD superfamily hydrolase